MGSPVLKTAPASEPLSLAEAKAFLRVDIPDDDALITDIITAARWLIESFMNRSLVTQVWDWYLDAFPHVDAYAVTGEGSRSIGSLEQFPTGYSLLYPRSGPIYLPKPPVQSVAFIKYIDITGAQQTLNISTTTYSLTADAIIDLAYERCRIMPAYGKYWPITLPVPNAVQIEYTSGYAGAPDGTAGGILPPPIKQAMRVACVDLYDMRGSHSPGVLNELKHFTTIKHMLMNYRAWSFT